MPTTQYVIVHSAGPAWNPGLPFNEQVGVMDHAKYYFGLFDQGKVERGGPFLSTQGGMMVLAAGIQQEEAIAIASADPAIGAGLLTFEVRLWLLAISPAAQ